ncbi:MAG: hypothetical protein ACRD8W_21190 [Nitrososphaeraceae archaeon]
MSEYSSFSTTYTISIDSIKLENKPKYVHVVKHSSADTLVTTIPRPYCKALDLSKGDVLAMTLDGRRVIMEKV